MKMFSYLIVASLTIFCLHAFADAPATAAPSVTPSVADASAPTVAPVTTSALSTFINSHGGMSSSIILVLMCMNSLLSALRDICARFDGVNPGDAAPVGDTKLTVLNKVCLILGKILDYVTANVQH